MDTLIIEGTLSLPAVSFNASNNNLEILGRSIPEHPEKFYRPLDEWLTEYLSSNPAKVSFKVYLDYLNTHSTECMLLLMKKLDAYNSSNPGAVSILWLFDEDDEDMENLGNDLASMIELSFEMQEVKED
jgi:hypothetical protein